MVILPVGYRFEKLTPHGYVLLAPHGEVVSRFYAPDDPDAGVIAAFHALGYAHGCHTLKRRLHQPLARLAQILQEARAHPAADDLSNLGTALTHLQHALDAV